MKMNTETYKPASQIQIGDKISLKTEQVVTITGRREGMVIAPLRTNKTVTLLWEGGEGEVYRETPVAVVK